MYTEQLLRDELKKVRFKMYCGEHCIVDTDNRIYGVKWGKPWNMARFARKESFLLEKLEAIRNEG